LSVRSKKGLFENEFEQQELVERYVNIVWNSER
jgi:hypothetical protein